MNRVLLFFLAGGMTICHASNANVTGTGRMRLRQTKTELRFSLRADQPLPIPAYATIDAEKGGAQVKYYNQAVFTMQPGAQGLVTPQRVVTKREAIYGPRPGRDLAAAMVNLELHDKSYAVGSTIRQVRRQRMPRAPATDPATADNVQEALARALTFERAGDWQKAAEHYQQVAAFWQEAAWVQAKLREMEIKIIQGTSTANTESQTWAVVIGITRYPRVKQNELRFASDDAKQFADFLRGRGIPPQNVLELPDELATAAAIRHAIDLFLGFRAGPKDTLVLYLAGHGVLDSRGAGYFLAHDSDPQDLETTAVSMSWLHGLVNDRIGKISQLLLFVDTCHAGALAQMQGTHTKVEDWGRGAKNLFALMAGRPRDVSREGEDFAPRNGLFTAALLSALRANATLTGDQLAADVKTIVERESKGRQRPVSAGLMPLVLFPQLERKIVPEDPVFLPVREALKHGPQLAFERLLKIPAGDGTEQGRERISIDVRTALEDAGQQVLLRYLTGEEDPPKQFDFERAAEDFRLARQLGDSMELEAKELFCRGRVLLYKPETREEGFQLLSKAVLYEPGAAWTFNGIGVAHLEAAHHDEAIGAFEDAARRAPDWSYPLHNMALAYAAKGDYEKAISTYHRAIYLTPQFTYLPYNLGLLLQRLNRLDDARAVLKAAHREAPNSAWLWNALGTLEAQRGQWSQAIESYQHALSLGSEFAAARHNLALAHKARGNAADALCLWRLNAARHPKFVPSLVSLATEIGIDTKEARAVARPLWERVLEQRKEYTAAHVELAALYTEEGNTGKATEYLGKVGTTSYWKASFVRSQLLCRQGEKDGARREYENALRAAPGEDSRDYVKARPCF